VLFRSELEADYANYLEALGAPHRLVRRYAYRNALLPQITGLALQLGTVLGGALVTEVVFAYPGLGYLILQAIQNQDFFLLQGALLFVVIGVLVANFLIDLAYVVVDPRTRTGMQEANACVPLLPPRPEPQSSRRPSATATRGLRPRPLSERPHRWSDGAAGCATTRSTSRCATPRWSVP